eukprot:scaffold7329_cov117-Cylindrotheca_fusiformis.AAC.1
MISRILALVALLACCSFVVGQEGVELSTLNGVRGLRGQKNDYVTRRRHLGVGPRSDDALVDDDDDDAPTGSYTSDMSKKGKGGKGGTVSKASKGKGGSSKGMSKGKGGSEPKSSKGKGGSEPKSSK